jgi:hypothetical protein
MTCSSATRTSPPGVSPEFEAVATSIVAKSAFGFV